MVSGIKIAEPSCSQREKALTLEWLETNGIGGFASSSILNCHTRKYHGLLVANLQTPPGRYVLLSKLEDALCIDDRKLYLSLHQYPGTFFPQDDPCLQEFASAPCPRFTYRSGDICVHKSIMMVRGQNTVLIRYDIVQCPADGLLRIRPFLAFRGYHGLARENEFIRSTAYLLENGVRFEPYEKMPPLIIQANGKATFTADASWYHNFQYFQERDRGYDWHEDLFCPGLFEIPVKQGASVTLYTSTDSLQGRIDQLWRGEEKRRSLEHGSLQKAATGIGNDQDRDLLPTLMAAGRQFLIKMPSERPAVIAGYPWFNDWGRDTLISLPGLTFCSGYPEQGREILVSLGQHVRNGLLPNFFSDNERDSAYNAADTSLWYFWAVQQMIQHTQDHGAIKKNIWPVLKNILRHFIQGTLFDIYMADNGLLHAGNHRTQLTWMDAAVEGKPVTPRWGFAVEINALWYNALCFAQELSQRFADRECSLEELIPKVRRSFRDIFWISKEAYLGDVFCEGRLDQAIRPNQILAVSLPYSPLDPSQWTGIVHQVKRHLLTPRGLRTLSPGDGNYRGVYCGNTALRDAAYHQGTVWPWLLGHFGEALLKSAEDRETARQFLYTLIRSFLRQHLTEAGIGCVSEIFDGSPPHRPHGCISQAWSIAELIRLYTILGGIQS